VTQKGSYSCVSDMPWRRRLLLLLLLVCWLCKIDPLFAAMSLDVLVSLFVCLFL